MEKAKRGRGRPPKDPAKKSVIVTATFPPEIAAWVKDTLGDGSMTRGLHRAVNEAKERYDRKKKGRKP